MSENDRLLAAGILSVTSMLIFEDWRGFFKTHRRIDLDESSGIAYSTTQCPTGDFPW